MTKQEILDQLNSFVPTDGPGGDLWNDVIPYLPGYDREATAEADPKYRSDVIVFADGGRIVYAAERQQWVEDE